MIGAAIGSISGLLIILIIARLKCLDKSIMYSLILTGIAFFYVGFTWTDRISLLICSLQVILFIFIAYFAVNKYFYILPTGYFLHGLWDLAYSFFQSSNLMPPQYDTFCITIDFSIGFYLVLLNYQSANKPKWLM
jgi:hypothetical protein